ncbi:hypothetical protein OG21DRAFT_1084356 [Imleria badia]|nr:hypothetical protein OG21DRAFT_1084356 [Imleria badia]
MMRVADHCLFAAVILASVGDRHLRMEPNLGSGIHSYKVRSLLSLATRRILNWIPVRSPMYAPAQLRASRNSYGFRNRQGRNEARIELSERQDELGCVSCCSGRVHKLTERLCPNEVHFRMCTC